MEENKVYKKCQSCGMPLNKDHNNGTEADGSMSTKYCNLCYQNGQFTEPNITLEEMQIKCAKAFKEVHPFMVIFFGKSYVKSIPKLERWNKSQNN